jgi:hypothetical protein
MSAYDWFMMVVVPFGFLGLFVVGLMKHEERLQFMENKIHENQERYLNRDK